MSPLLDFPLSLPVSLVRMDDRLQSHLRPVTFGHSARVQIGCIGLMRVHLVISVAH